MERAESVLRTETEDVRVTEWRFKPGAATGHHRHGFDYVVVPLTAGVLHIESAEGLSKVALTPGASYFRKAGVEHNVINGGGDDLAFVEIELLRQPG